MTHQAPAAGESTLRAACADLERRLRAGEDVHAEDAFAAHPALADHDDAAVDLIYVEYLARTERGQRAIAEEFYARFPRWREYLRLQFEAEAILREQADASLPTPKFAAMSNAEPGAPTGLGWPRHYELLGELGRGGMGVVFKARQVSLNRVVALKMLRWEAEGGGELARLRAEAEAVARLQHPGVVQIFEVGEQDGRPFLALEFVAGGSLAGRVAGHPQPPRDAAALVAKLAEAIHYAHTLGVIHRDLKPANVLLVSSGAESGQWSNDRTLRTAPDAPLTSHQPKITDFGLARILDSDSRQTQTGARLGTPSYMAPEQAAGDSDVGPAADIWALGAILYECLTGRPPFLGPTALETMEQVRTRDPVPPARLQAQVPRDLDTICSKCLRKEPAARYATAQDLADDLGRFLAGRPVQARPIGPFARGWRWAKRRPAIAGLLGALAVAVVGGVAGIFDQWRRAEALAVAMRGERDAADSARARAEANDERAQAVLGQLVEVGNSLLDQPRIDPARQKVVETVLGFYQTLLAERGDDPAIRLAAAKAARRVALLRRELGQFAQADAAWQQCLDLSERLVADFPDEAEYRLQLAVVLRHRADILRNRNQTIEAERDYRRAAELLEVLVAGEPQSARHLSALAATMHNLAYTLKNLRRPDEAERAYRRALNSYERAEVTTKVKSTVGLLVGMTRGDLGAHLAENGRPVEGESLLRQAVAECERHYAAAPESRDARTYLSRTLYYLAQTLARGPKRVEALDYYRRSATIREQMVKDFPTIPVYRSNWAASLNGVARLLRAPEQAAERLAVRRQVVSIWEGLVAEYPADDVYRQQLASNAGMLGTTLDESGQSAEAIDVLRTSLRLVPDDAGVNARLAWLFATAADTSLRDPAEAVALARKAVSGQPKNAYYRNTLGVALYRAGHDADAVVELEAAAAARPAVDPYDMFFLAMAYHRRGDAAKARLCFDRGSLAADKIGTPSDELRRFRAEAAAVIERP